MTNRRNKPYKAKLRKQEGSYTRLDSTKGLKKHNIPSLLGVTPVTAILAGRGLRAIGADRRYTTPEAVVDVDIALPGREPPDA